METTNTEDHDDQWGDESDWLDEYDAETAAAEIAAENAWLRQAEYDPEAEAFDAWERANGVVDFADAMAAAR
jgi:hypothetical protein